MSRNNIFLVIIISNLLLTCKTYAQDAITNKMGEYLVKIKEIDSAVYSVKTKSKKSEIITNFYIDKLLSLQSNNGQIVFFRFGSYTEHQRPHFALITNDDLNKICFIDCVNVEESVKRLLSCLEVNGVVQKELEAFKVKVLKYYINGFPAASNVQL